MKGNVNKPNNSVMVSAVCQPSVGHRVHDPNTDQSAATAAEYRNGTYFKNTFRI